MHHYKNIVYFNLYDEKNSFERNIFVGIEIVVFCLYEFVVFFLFVLKILRILFLGINRKVYFHIIYLYRYFE